MSAIVNKDRKCDGCTACCSAMGVPEIGKGGGCHCPHATPLLESRKSGGCGIYESRPKSCRKFKCLWLHGFGRELERPDRTGLVCEIQSTRMGLTIVVFESIVGAWECESNADFRQSITQTGLSVYVVHWKSFKRIILDQSREGARA